VLLIAAVAPRPGLPAEGTPMAEKTHFTIESGANDPSPAAIGARLERTWRTFHDLFGVDPAPVRVVLSVAAGGPAPARPEHGSGAATHAIAWTVVEGEDLEGQGFSDLAHEIAHIYFLDVMGNPGGLHQDHAWLHEAVACHHEGGPALANRREWIRLHLDERVPLAELFTARNPVKGNPLVELTVRLHERLAKGEITAAELNAQVSAFAAGHAGEIARAGASNMTWYAESLSVLEFLLATEGAPFVRTMAHRLRDGGTMEVVVRERWPGGVAEMETAWVAWVRKGGQ
jgi:hypothetical protein